MPKGMRMKTYKLQVQEDERNPQRWRNVVGADGKLLIFDDEPSARARLEALYPVLVKMERFQAGPKRTRVVIVSPYQDIDDEWNKK